jgi:YD repeat-containing protein
MAAARCFTGKSALPSGSATITQPPIIQATFKDARGNTTTFETDAIGRVTKQIDPLNRTTTIARDPQGNPLVITRPNRAVTTMSGPLTISRACANVRLVIPRLAHPTTPRAIPSPPPMRHWLA